MRSLVPFRRHTDMADVFRGMDELMRRMWSGLPFGEWEAPDFVTEWTPAVDISETDKVITVKAELPGLGKKDIDISLDEQHLVIKGEKKQEQEESGEHFHRLERSYGSFYRAIALPGTVEKEKIDATFKNGVLTVTLPKSKEAIHKITHVNVH